MPKYSHSQNSFSAGEIAPEVRGRRDIDKYDSGATTVENFIVTPEGGLHRRSGTRFVSEAIDSNKRSTLTPFVSTDGESYQLEFSEQFIRVFKGTEQVNVPDRTFNSTIVDLTTEEFEIEDHGYRDSQGPFNFLTTTGSLPLPLTSLTDYYITTPPTHQFESVLISPSADSIFITDHGYVEDQGPFRLRMVGLDASGNGFFPNSVSGTIDAFTDFYILRVDDDRIRIRDAPGLGGWDFADRGAGFFEIYPTKEYRRNKFGLSATPGGLPINMTTAGTGVHTFVPAFTLVPPSSFTVYLPVEIPTPYLESEISELRFAQSDEALYIVHKNHRPAQLSKISDSQWRLIDVGFVDGPYLDANSGTVTTSSHALLSRCNLVYSSADVINDGNGWGLADIGRIVRFNVNGQIPGYVEIDSIVPGSGAAIGTVFQFAGGAAGVLTEWNMGAWYKGNYPSMVALSEQRLCFAGEPQKPDTVTTSNVGSLNVMRPTGNDAAKTVNASNSVRVAVADSTVNIIRWLSVGESLLIGTNSAIFALRGDSDNGTFSPLGINAIKLSATGVSSIIPISVERETAYLTNNSQGFRSIKSGSNRDTLEEQKTFDLAILARHIFGRTLSIEDIAYQFDRRSIIWLVRSDGVMLGCTYIPEEKIFAWHRHIIGGTFLITPGDPDVFTNAIVESVSVDRNTGGSFDRVWIIVKRTINGSTKRYVEFFEDEWLDGISSNQQFVDSHPIEPSTVPRLLFPRFGHLIGETLQVLGDGGVLPDATVFQEGAVEGHITTTELITDLTAGFGYTSTFESLPLEVNDPSGNSGTSMGKMARSDHVILRLFDSQTGEVGVPQWDGNVVNWTNIIERGAGDVIGSPPSPFTGDKKILLDGGFDREKVIRIRQTQPVGFNLLAMNVMGNSGTR